MLCVKVRARATGTRNLRRAKRRRGEIVMWNLIFQNRSRSSWQWTYCQSVLRATTRTARTSPPSFYINHHFRLSSKRTLTAPNATQTLNTEIRKFVINPMAFSKAMFIAVMSVLVAVISAADAPAPSPTSPAVAVSPSFVAGVVGAVAALAFGSSLRIWA